ncbi:acetyl-CoA synthetase-like protein [Polyporus arcularius HHB13444]|uniref:Acetyl-CoA synthetase-like protein n=1 Tax=Polyporus arcularius HHB13444 TaxID=1314778 RepID=A0A5C3NQT4_9APHY|nr:acetyl-CoA synthetase-like protein [Polyporus arcularius HHB13444]
MPLDLATLPAHVTTDFHPSTELVKQTDFVLPKVYEWHAKENPNYPLFVYHDGDHLQYITYSQANRAMDRIARFVASIVGTGHATPPVVALFANADTITYFVTAVGIMRAGCTLFPVSTRNAAVAVADMFKRTATGHMIISSDAVLREAAKEALEELAKVEHSVVQLDLPTFEDLFAENLDATSPLEAVVELPTTFDMNTLASIMHSSGSTGHPKTIGWTHKMMGRWARLPLTGDLDLHQAVMGSQGTPMFHGLGSFMYAAAPTVGFIVAVFKPAVPPTVPTPDAVWQSFVETGTDFSWNVPSFIEEWSRDPEKVDHMKQMRGLMYGGAALNEEVGDSLASKGVSLYGFYGLTEAGLVNNFNRTNPGKNWAWWEPNPDAELVFSPAGDGTYEVIVLSPADIPLPKTNTTIGDREAYATSDLVIPHPTRPGTWKIVGRADEQIILSNGEKTNPIPLEKIINDDPHVKCSIMFGRGKFQNGVLIEPTEDYAFDPSDVKKLEVYRNKIWPTIERVNEYAPQHSRIFKEMIIVTSPSKPFQFTEKRQPRRNFILKAYNDEIEDLYKEIENSSQSEFAAPTVWDSSSTLDFVRTVVQSTLRRDIGDADDIFRNGGDSLQATYIRNTILRALREANKDAPKRLPANLVFAAPTISALSRVVYGAVSTDGPSASHTAADLWKYVEKYSSNLPARPKILKTRPTGKEVVIITGTTGGFGCDTLEHLLRDETVGKVYAFNRKGSKAMERQRAQFTARGLDETLLDSPKFVMVESVLHEHEFGLEPAFLEGIRNSVTHIMHNAWKVNFNITIPSFEVDIQGARNFVDLALSSPYTQPPSIIFVSSVGIFANYNGPSPVPETPVDDPAVPFGSGYPESKWVTERVLQNVSAKTDVHTVVMRLGQVAGDRLGYWNEKEWFPSLVKSALFQKCLPDIEGDISWFPAYEAAKAFAEMRHSPEPFLHLIHPRTARWHTVMAPIAELFDVPLVPYDQWVSALETSVEAGSAAEVEMMRQNPALRILPFFKAAKEPVDGREAFGFVFLSTDKATKVSESLAQMPMLDAERAKLWVAAWKKSGFL